MFVMESHNVKYLNGPKYYAIILIKKYILLFFNK